jgi:hypothetical protein
VWAIYKVFQTYDSRDPEKQPPARLLLIFLLCILALDLPIMFSYNYPTRFFLPMMPLFAILGALLIRDLYSFLAQRENTYFRRLATAAFALLILFSFARNISVMLLFLNDARIPASAFVRTLPPDTSLEHTLYPPAIPANHFEREHNYPIHFIKVLGGGVPASDRYVFNAGETGLDERMTDYLVTDSFTWTRFDDPYICETMPAECEFFQQLETGESNHYRLVAEFFYKLPPYLPQMNIAFVNPAIRVYERIQ